MKTTMIAKKTIHRSMSTIKTRISTDGVKIHTAKLVWEIGKM